MLLLYEYISVSAKSLIVYLPPATKLGQGNVFTGVCDSVHGGGGGSLPQCMLGYRPSDQPPRPQADPSGADPPEQTPSRADTPRSRHPLESRHHHPTPGADTPLAQSMLGDTVNARVVRILLECNLVCLHNSNTYCNEFPGLPEMWSGLPGLAVW